MATSEAHQALNDALLDHLYWCIFHGQPKRLGPMNWAMSEEWFQTLRGLTDKQGRPLCPPGFGADRLALLFGMPIEVRQDAGVPHLEVR